MKRILIVASIAAALALTGCASRPDSDYDPPTEDEQSESAEESLVVVTEILPDGRTVICLTNELTLSCDWSNAK